MAPVIAEAPPAVHVFAIDPAEAPRLAEREAMVRALRRAVMARVDEEFRRDRARRHDPLPSFFTGHEPEGAPTRPGHHEHLFFLANDCDGDGRIDRLAVIAPHLADRSVVSSNRSTTSHLRLLDQALSELTILRAGQAGAPRLLRATRPDEDDPIFGSGKCWISRSLYRPTRHPKGEDIKTAVAEDLLAECARRGLPRPEVEVLDVKVGPRGGLAARARLRFEAAVMGPLLLGRGSHFGEGMFGAE
jgi:CRISPR-associated protein Csb2